MINRKKIRTATAAIALGVASLPLAGTALAAPPITKGLVSFSVQGIGTGSIATSVSTCGGLSCKVAGNCDCLTGSDTLIGNQGFSGGSFNFTLLIDLTETSLLTSDFGNCDAATGGGTISNSNKSQQVTIDVSGLACSTASGTDVFNGTFVVVGGKGKYSTASGGSGAINGSQLNSTGTGPSQVTVTGSLQPTQGS